MREREAAREAAVKGTHIDLIPKFLSAKLDLNLSEAEKWFKDQVRAFNVFTSARHCGFR